MKRIALLVLLLVLAISLCGCSSSDYKKATELYNTGEYTEAAALFEQLGDYEDSGEMAKASKYARAVNLFEDGSFEEARVVFTELADYSDCKDRVIECNYLNAVSCYDNQEYDVAVEIFDQLKDYKDSAKYSTDCHFLSDIAESILNRREQNAKNTDYTTLTNTELAYMEKYRSAVFHDSGLQKLAKDYLKGLDDQKAALKLSYSEHQIAWTNGQVERYRVLKKLSQDYGVLEDDKEFVATYVTGCQELENKLAALKVIDNDLENQLDGVTFSSAGSYYISAPYTNNTKYTFDITIYITYYKADRKLLNSDVEFETVIANSTRVGESTNSFNSLKPKSTTTLKLYMPSRDWNVCEFFWTINDIS